MVNRAGWTVDDLIATGEAVIASATRRAAAWSRYSGWSSRPSGAAASRWTAAAVRGPGGAGRAGDAGRARGADDLAVVPAGEGRCWITGATSVALGGIDGGIDGRCRLTGPSRWLLLVACERTEFIVRAVRRWVGGSATSDRKKRDPRRNSR